MIVLRLIKSEQNAIQIDAAFAKGKVEFSEQRLPPSMKGKLRMQPR